MVVEAFRIIWKKRVSGLAVVDEKVSCMKENFDNNSLFSTNTLKGYIVGCSECK